MADWYELAGRLLELERRMIYLQSTPTVGVFLSHRDEIYISQYQEINPSNPRIVMVSKEPKALPGELATAIKGIDKERSTLRADDDLDLSQRTYVLRKLENRLTAVIPEQKTNNAIGFHSYSKDRTKIN